MTQSTDQILYFTSEGKGNPVLILHGLLGTGNNWRTIANELADTHTVYRLDMRNHGRSFHSDQFNYDVMAEDVLRFMDRRGLDRISLIGHSMGGKVAMKFAFSHPHRIRKLIVADICNKTYKELHQDLIEALFQLDLARISRLKDADELLKSAIPNRDMRLFLMSNLKRHHNGGYHWQVNLEAIRNNQKNLSAKVSGKPFSGPSLFIRGGKSRYIQDSDWPKILKDLPFAELITIPGAGHWVHIEAQDGFLAAVSRFLAQ